MILLFGLLGWNENSGSVTGSLSLGLVGKSGDCWLTESKWSPLSLAGFNSWTHVGGAVTTLSLPNVVPK